MDENFKTYKATLDKFYAAFQFFYPKYFNPNFDGRPPTRDFVYSGERIPKTKFIDDVLEFTDAKDDLRNAFDRLVELHRMSDTELAATLPGAALREQQAETLEESEEKLKASQEKAKSDVQTAIDRKKKIVEDRIKIAQAAKEKLKKETKFVKVEKEPSQPVLPEDFVNETKKDPIKTYDFLIKDMESKIPEKEVPQKDIEFAAAYIVVNAIKEDKAATDAFAAQKLKDYPELKDLGEIFADPSMEQHNLAKVIADRAYGTNNPFVPAIKSIEISDTDQPGFTALPLYNFAERAESNLKGQKQILDGKIDRPAWMMSELEKKLAIIKGGGIQGAEGNYREYIVQGYLLKFSPGPTITEDVAALNSRLDIASGAGDTFKLVGGLAGGAAKQAVIKTATKGLVGLISKATAPETGGLSILAAQALNWIADKINTKEVKKWFLAAGGAAVAAVGFAFGFPVIGYLGLGVTVGGVASAQGITFASAGSGVLSALGAIGLATLGAIGAPILAALIGLPVLVALILFIINSGAYVVPPTLLQTGYAGIGGVNMVCDNTPIKSENPVANAAINISSYLNQFSLNPLTVNKLNTPGWKSLAGVLPESALGALEASAHVDNHLQCVGFVAATAGLAYGQAFDQINACQYIGNAPPGYKYVPGTYGISSGDFFLINGRGGCRASSPGHIGVVVSVDGALISCADANMVGSGAVCVRHGCFALSQLTGYLRKK